MVSGEAGNKDGPAAMASIQEDILEEFYKRLTKAEGFTEDKVKLLRDLFSGSKKPKPADVIKVFSENPGENLP
jgi:hypothetical protein